MIRYLAEDSETAQLLENAIDGAARSSAEIRNVEAYLLTAVARQPQSRRDSQDRQNRQAFTLLPALYVGPQASEPAVF